MLVDHDYVTGFVVGLYCIRSKNSSLKFLSAKKYSFKSILILVNFLSLISAI